MKQLTRLIEAALFSADRPLTLTELSVLEREADKSEIKASIEELRDVYDNEGHGVELIEVADGYQVLTRREFAEAIVEARVVTRPRKPSPAAMETLAIIAYRQPVGRAEIEEIRGVAADGVVRSLQERGLIEPVGRGEGLGRPILYGTTPQFLELLGIKSIEELPRLEELSIALTPPPRLGESGEGPDVGNDPDQIEAELNQVSEVSTPEVSAENESEAAAAVDSATDADPDDESVEEEGEVEAGEGAGEEEVGSASGVRVGDN